MAYFEEGSEAMVALEGMVDKAGLRNVLYALETICFAKAQHISEAWQDDGLSMTWAKEANRVGRCASSVQLAP